MLSTVFGFPGIFEILAHLRERSNRGKRRRARTRGVGPAGRSTARFRTISHLPFLQVSRRTAELHRQADLVGPQPGRGFRLHGPHDHFAGRD